MAGSNKLNAGRFCPLLDSGPPKGDVWVVVKKAVLPYQVVEMGTGPEGLQKLKLANQRINDARPQETNQERAIKAYMKAEHGHFLDALKKPDIAASGSVQEDKRLAEWYPPEPPKTRLERVWTAVKKACRSVWDAAQEE